MNHKEEKVTMHTIETSRKVCSRAKEHTSKNTTEVSERKHVPHSGIKFKGELKKKVTIPKPFSFDTGPKIRKVTPNSSPEKTPGKPKNEGTQSKITIETFKISKETTSSSKTRSVSNTAETSKCSKTDDARNKKTCTRYSRIAKPQIEISRTPSSPVATPRASKPRAQSPNTPKSERKCLKSAMSPAHSSNTVKSQQVHFFKAEKSEVKISCSKGCEFSTVETSKCETSKGTKHEFDASDIRVKMSSSGAPNAEATDTKLPNGLETKPGCDIRNAENAATRPQNGLGTNHESDSSNETDSDPSNGMNPDCEDSGTKDCESGTPKKSSKIPRKNYGAHSGLKFITNFKKETVPEPFNFENRCSNFKKENIQREANQIKITEIVNN